MVEKERMKQIHVRRRRVAAVFLVAGLSGCGGGSPSNPNPGPTPPVTTLPPPTTMPVTTLCTDPTPPPLRDIIIKINSVNPENPSRIQLDSRPVVNNVDNYCQRVGLSGSRCDTRPEGDPQRGPCDALVMGRAADTGRFGPTWTWNDQPCSPAEVPGQPGCSNHQENQFLVIARGDGTFGACAALDVPVAEGGSRCGFFNIP